MVASCHLPAVCLLRTVHCFFGAALLMLHAACCGCLVPCVIPASNLLFVSHAFYFSCLFAQSLGKLGDLLGLPQFDDSNGVHQLVQSLREFVNREESATNSPAGALKTALTNIRRTYHHPAPSPCIKVKPICRDSVRFLRVEALRLSL